MCSSMRAPLVLTDKISYYFISWNYRFGIDSLSWVVGESKVSASSQAQENVMKHYIRIVIFVQLRFDLTKNLGYYFLHYTITG